MSKGKGNKSGAGAVVGGAQGMPTKAPTLKKIPSKSVWSPTTVLKPTKKK